MRIIRETKPEIPSGSMADIAFLLLVFFLVTTSIVDNRGILMVLPPDPEINPSVAEIHERNLFRIMINSQGRLLVEDVPMEDLGLLNIQLREFILNPHARPELSDSPADAIVSLQSNRGTAHGRYIEVLDEIQGAYFDIYSERAGVSNVTWRTLADNLHIPDNQLLYEKGRGQLSDGSVMIPMNISIAEPN